jgi:hypothetical protein
MRFALAAFAVNLHFCLLYSLRPLRLMYLSLRAFAVKVLRFALAAFAVNLHFCLLYSLRPLRLMYLSLRALCG